MLLFTYLCIAKRFLLLTNYLKLIKITLMKKQLHLSAIALCLAATASVSAQGFKSVNRATENSSLRKLVCTYTLGYTMEGYGADDEISRKEVNYYDTDNNLAYTAYYGSTADKSFSLTKFVKYNTYERNDSIFHDASCYEWGLFNFGDPALKAVKPSGVMSQAYSKDGKLLREVQASYTYDYEYGDKGLLEKMTKAYTSSGNVSEICSYLYDDTGRLLAVTATDSKGVFKYKNTFEYDDAGNKTEAVQWKRKTASEETSEYIYQREEWKYTDGVLSEYIKYTGGKAATETAEAKEPAPSSRKTYEVYKGNSNQTLITSYSYNKTDATWIKGGLPSVEEYADFMAPDVASSMYGTELNVVADKNTYSTKVSFAVPQVSHTLPVKMTLYRDCHVVKTLTIAETAPNELDLQTGEITVSDDSVLVGKHDYFVQTEVGYGDELATADELTWTPANISSVASVDVDYDIKPVTDLKLEEAKKETVNQEDGTTNLERTAVVSYKNPAIDENSGFVKNELYTYVDSYGYTSYTWQDEALDAEQTTMSSAFPNNSDAIKLLVVSHYKYGTVKSDILTVTKDDFDALSSIMSNASIDNGMKVNLGKDAVSINGKADFIVLSADGRLLGSEKNTSAISTANVSGTYIICVVKDGKIVKTVKAVR